MFGAQIGQLFRLFGEIEQRRSLAAPEGPHFRVHLIAVLLVLNGGSFAIDKQLPIAGSNRRSNLPIPCQNICSSREWTSIFSIAKPRRKRELLYDKMLGVMAGDLVPGRPDRSEPRVKK